MDRTAPGSGVLTQPWLNPDGEAMMPADKSLSGYLTDHMAGSVSASDLAKRGAKRNEGPIALFFADLSREIELDRRTLASVAEQCGVDASPLKEAGAVVAERLSRFKIDHRVTGSPQLSLLLELELLYLGIEGKHTLWRTLGALSGHESGLSGFDFDKLARRATEQLAAVEEQRLAVAVDALSG
jgi:hypothetical protein